MGPLEKIDTKIRSELSLPMPTNPWGPITLGVVDPSYLDLPVEYKVPRMIYLSTSYTAIAYASATVNLTIYL